MDPRVAPLAGIFELNTDLLLNCLDGLSQDEAQRRLDGGGNSVIFLAAHLTDTRHFLLGRLGHPRTNPLSRYLADAQSVEDIGEWPTLDEVRDLAEQLAGALELARASSRMAADQLQAPAPAPSPAIATFRS